MIFTFLLEFVLSFLLTGRIMIVMETYDTPVQAIEPFLWTFGDGTAVLLSSLLLLLLFSDLPKMTPVTPYQLIRTTKKKMAVWAVYLRHPGDHFVHSAYASFLLLCCACRTVIPAICGAKPPPCLAIPALAKPAGAVHCKSYGKHFPYGCMLQVFLLLFAIL